RSARRRPRRRRHRSRVRRRPRGGTAGAPRRRFRCSLCASWAHKEQRRGRAGAMKVDRRLVLGWILPVLVIAALIGLWQIAASTGAIAEALNIEPYLVPSPAEVGDALWNNRSLLWENAWVTLREILLGLLASIVLGVLLAIPMRFSRIVSNATYPLAVAT